MDFTPIFENYDLYLEGLVTTVKLVSVALAIGLAMAIPLAIMRTSSNPLVNGPVWAFTYFFRGTPLLVQMFLIYYGLGQFQAVRDSVAWTVLGDAQWCGWIALTLNTSAYVAEILRGGINGVAHGEVEATLPQAFDQLHVDHVAHPAGVGGRDGGDVAEELPVGRRDGVVAGLGDRDLAEERSFVMHVDARGELRRSRAACRGAIAGPTPGRDESVVGGKPDLRIVGACAFGDEPGEIVGASAFGVGKPRRDLREHLVRRRSLPVDQAIRPSLHPRPNRFEQHRNDAGRHDG